MGTHPNVPAKLSSSSSTTLASHLTSNPELVGEKVSSKFEVTDGNLPFLFKVLSIGTALSIQAHPDKKLAERLFKDHGDIYKGMLGFDPAAPISVFREGEEEEETYSRSCTDGQTLTINPKWQSLSLPFSPFSISYPAKPSSYTSSPSPKSAH
jgi:hypothetical protein